MHDLVVLGHYIVDFFVLSSTSPTWERHMGKVVKFMIVYKASTSFSFQQGWAGQCHSIPSCSGGPFCQKSLAREIRD